MAAAALVSANTGVEKDLTAENAEDSAESAEKVGDRFSGDSSCVDSAARTT